VNDASSRDACLAVVLELLQAPEATAQLKPGAAMFAVLHCLCLRFCAYVYPPVMLAHVVCTQWRAHVYACGVSSLPVQLGASASSYDMAAPRNVARACCHACHLVQVGDCCSMHGTTCAA
jgi:hypothetical protein